MKENRFCAIILAAGFSSRMVNFKPLLKLGQETIIERAVDLFLSAGIKDIKVVTGFQKDQLDESLKRMNIPAIYNPEYEQGMFTSIKAGINSLYNNDCEAFFILPVDIPLVKRETVEKLADKYTTCEKHGLIYYPVFRGKRGHPPLISSRLAWNILNFNGNGGLKELLKDYEDKAVDVEVDDEFILMDCDTPEDYEKLLKYNNNFDRKIPSIIECIDILNKLLPEDTKIVQHCKQVAALAVHFAKAVKMTGSDIELVSAGALLHDVARKEKRHAEAGAAITNELGYPAVAEIVKSHVDIDLDSNTELDAAQIVYLADKLVKRTSIVSLDERFYEKIHGNDKAASEAAGKRLANAHEIQRRLEVKTGSPLEDIIAGFNDGEFHDLFA